MAGPAYIKGDAGNGRGEMKPLAFGINENGAGVATGLVGRRAAKIAAAAKVLGTATTAAIAGIRPI
jgi:hypothetical protein